MNLILLRHGEASDNVKGLISDKEIYWSTLTEDGINTVKKSVKCLPEKIDRAYVSPLPRTIQTANFVYQKYPDLEFVIDNRIREIQYGKYSHCENNEKLDEVRTKQIAGDFYVRFGETGDNKYDIEKRLSSFLVDVLNNHDSKSTILVVTHGSISSYIKRILKVKSKHLQTGEVEIFEDIDLLPAKEHLEMLNDLVK